MSHPTSRCENWCRHKMSVLPSPLKSAAGPAGSGPSSLSMMPWPWPCGSDPSTAFCGWVRATKKTSWPSGTVSPNTLTTIVFVVSEGAKIRRPSSFS
jgi:hypothetical protein